MENCKMTFISEYASIKSLQVIGKTKEQEQELRDSYEVWNSVKNSHKKEIKKKNYYRLVNGIPADGNQSGWRHNEYLDESGFFLLDYDFLDKDGKKKKMNYIDVWNKIKKHLKEWGIVHVERSARGGVHITAIRTKGLSIEENIRLFELRTGIEFDHCKDTARACFLVPNEYVIYVDDEQYYSDKKPTPLPLSEKERLMMETDKMEREIKHQKEIEERRKSAPVLDCHGMTDEQSQLRFIVDIVVKRGIDLTRDYNNWILVGFLIGNVMGLAGESLFHDISRLYPQYRYDETHRVYENLVRTSRHEIGLGTLIHLARLEGVFQ